MNNNETLAFQSSIKLDDEVQPLWKMSTGTLE